MPPFEDHFSKRAHEYARSRPSHPRELFDYLATVTPRRRLAWDCGTGNGQAARELVRHFDQVVGTDASAEQLSHAVPHERIDYRVELAEEASLEAGSVDLVTAAVAVHWFDLERFYATVRRVSAAHGILAVWSYHLPVISSAVDRAVEHYHSDVLGGYWPERFQHVVGRYRTLPFPFEELDPPRFEMRGEWELAQLVGFLESWSAAQRYQEERGHPAPSLITPRLAQAWGEPGTRRPVRWPIFLRVGRVR